jgi:hypothetical protein
MTLGCFKHLLRKDNVDNTISDRVATYRGVLVQRNCWIVRSRKYIFHSNALKYISKFTYIILLRAFHWETFLDNVDSHTPSILRFDNTQSKNEDTWIVSLDEDFQTFIRLNRKQQL